MPERFPRPAFMDFPHHPLPIEPLYEGDTDKEIHGGSFVEVKQIPPAGLPKGVQERFGEGFVIKRYRDDRPDQKKIFDQDAVNAWARLNEDDQLLFGEIGLPREKKRKILTERHQALRRYFAGDLPDLIMKTSIFVGKDAQKNPIGLYELQPRLRGFFSPFRVSPHPVIVSQWEEVKEYVDNAHFGPTQWRQGWCESVAYELRNRGVGAERFAQLARELRAFVRLANAMPTEAQAAPLREKFLDIRGADNLVITREGHLCLIDTNILFRNDHIGGDWLLYDEFQVLLNELLWLVAHLENYGSITIE